MVTLASQNLEQVDKKVLKAFSTGYTAYQEVYPEVFIVEKPQRKDERFAIVQTGSEIDEVNDGAAAPEHRVRESAANQISVRVYKASVPIGDLAEVFDNYGTIDFTAKSKAFHMNYKTDSLCAGFLNNATSTTSPYGFTINGSTYSLVGTTQAIGDTGSTQSNRVSGALDPLTANSARTALRKQKNHDGTIFGFQAKRIIVPAEEEKNAWEIFNSPMNPASANNNRNFLNTLGTTVIPWQLLSSTTACFLMADRSDMGAKGLRLEVALPPMIQRVYDTDAGIWKYLLKQILYPGVVDYLGIVSVGL